MQHPSKPGGQPRPDLPDGKPLRLIIPCAIGIEKALGNELRHGGFFIADSAPGRAEVAADLRDALLALRSLRTAERVLVVLADFPAYTFEDLFQGCRAVDWAAWVKPDSRLRIDKVRLRDSALDAVASVQAVVQKAAYQRLGEQAGLVRLPETGGEHLVRVYIENNRARIALDLAGEALHRRGWRTEAGVAPLKETIAASMVVLSGWRRRHPLLDPFCGAGTIAAEALSFAANLAPNLERELGFAGLAAWDAAADAAVRESLRAAAAPDATFDIAASDIDPGMAVVTRRNLRAMLAASGLDPAAAKRLEAMVRTAACPAAAAELRGDSGWIVTNPPYGERIGDDRAAREIYRGMGRWLHERPDWNVLTITTHPDFEREIGRRAMWKKPVRNGASEATLYFHGLKTPQKRATINRERP